MLVLYVISITYQKYYVTSARVGCDPRSLLAKHIFEIFIIDVLGNVTIFLILIQKY